MEANVARAGMTYLLMCWAERAKLATMSQSECQTLVDETSVYCEALARNGHLIVAEPPELLHMSLTVRVRNGTVSVSDARLAETKEQIGGFFLISARDLNEAIQVASRCPAARLGSMEVRPVTARLRGA
jgi:hypothetical protein